MIILICDCGTKVEIQTPYGEEYRAALYKCVACGREDFTAVLDPRSEEESGMDDYGGR